MTKRKTLSTEPEPNNQDLPDWVLDDSPGRSIPYTEEELDILVEGTLKGIQDTAAWKNLVQKVGEEEARQVLRTRLIMRDEKAATETRH